MSEFPFDAYLALQGWEGLTKTPIKVIGETPKRYRIQAVERMALAGRSRWINQGETALVPKYAIRRNHATKAGTT